MFRVSDVGSYDKDSDTVILTEASGLPCWRTERQLLFVRDSLKAFDRADAMY